MCLFSYPDSTSLTSTSVPVNIHSALTLTPARTILIQGGTVTLTSTISTTTTAQNVVWSVGTDQTTTKTTDNGVNQYVMKSVVRDAAKSVEPCIHLTAGDKLITKYTDIVVIGKSSMKSDRLYCS